MIESFIVTVVILKIDQIHTAKSIPLLFLIY